MLESTVVFTAELDENIIPNFQNVGVILIDQVGSISSANAIKMDFAEFSKTVNIYLREISITRVTCRAHKVQSSPFLWRK